MSDLLNYLEVWKTSKARIFNAENYEVSISNVLGDSKKARYIDLDTDKLVARATLWETGELELNAIDIATGKTAIHKSTIVVNDIFLDGELNWWLSEIAIW